LYQWVLDGACWWLTWGPLRRLPNSLVGDAVHTHFYEFPEFPYPEEYRLADTDLPDGQLVRFPSRLNSSARPHCPHSPYPLGRLVCPGLDMVVNLQIYDYCCAYVEMFNLREKIQFETRFLRLEPQDPEGTGFHDFHSGPCCRFCHAKHCSLTVNDFTPMGLVVLYFTNMIRYSEGSQHPDVIWEVAREGGSNMFA
jgi:hypothetical protein